MADGAMQNSSDVNDASAAAPSTARLSVPKLPRKQVPREVSLQMELMELRQQHKALQRQVSVHPTMAGDASKMSCFLRELLASPPANSPPHEERVLDDELTSRPAPLATTDLAPKELPMWRQKATLAELEPIVGPLTSAETEYVSRFEKSAAEDQPVLSTILEQLATELQVRACLAHMHISRMLTCNQMLPSSHGV